MKLVSVEEMQAIEKEADAGGLTYDLMMENAGRGLADEIAGISYSQDEGQVILGLVGPGNNGGDALVALAHLAGSGWKSVAYLVKRKSENDPLVDRVLEAGGEVLQASRDKDLELLFEQLDAASVLVDGLLGTGIRLPLKDDIATVLAVVKEKLGSMEWPPYVVAVDCPSGTDSDTGETATECIPADLTVTMAAVKRGLLRLPAFEYIGDLRVVSIGDLDGLKTWEKIQNQVASSESVREILPPRPADAHKGTFGTAVIAAGSVNYTGAALLAGQAAYRCGAGLVTLAVPVQVHSALAGQFAEATWLLLPSELGVISREAADVLGRNLDRATALLLGPGFGEEDTTLEFIENLLRGTISHNKGGKRSIGFVRTSESADVEKTGVALPPLVFDADGLKLLSKIDSWPELLPGSAVLTPHPGEMEVLTGLSKDEIQTDRLTVCRQFAEKWGHVVVLKGAFTVIAAPDGRTTTVPVATPALARAGTGDVLAGLIVGWLAQGLDPYDAAVAGAYVHAVAGLYARDEVGTSASVLAGDVLAAINDVLADLNA